MRYSLLMGLPQDKRIVKLNKIAIHQMILLTEDKNIKKLESENKKIEIKNE